MGCAGDHGLARGKAASVAVRACRHSMQGMLAMGGAAQDDLHSVAMEEEEGVGPDAQLRMAGFRRLPWSVCSIGPENRGETA